MYDSECLSLRLCLDGSFFNAYVLTITSPPHLHVSLYLCARLCLFSCVRVSGCICSCVCGPAVNGPLHFPPIAVKEGNDL